MKKKLCMQLVRLGVLGLFLWGSFFSTAWAKSEAYFNKPVDKRFAWLNNDAHGDVDFQAKIIELIESATVSIDVSTMSFGGVNGIADALATAAKNGKKVRIIGNSGHRFGEGFQRALRGPVQIADNNLPALVQRINFQQRSSSVPEGFLPDYGDAYGDRGNGQTYGWITNIPVAADFRKTPLTEYGTSLLGDTYAKANTTSAQWQIALPNGYYYVVVNVGQAGYPCRNYIKAQGWSVFTYKTSTGAIQYSDYKDTASDVFSCSVAEGGETGGTANSRRVQVTNGKLILTVGQGQSASKFTSLNFVEIYRASPTAAYGDNGSNKQYVQDRQLQHSKYVLIDGGTPQAKLWTGSGNFTAAMLFLSEDAILTDEKEICEAFYKEFNQMWGGTTAIPNSTAAAFGSFKTAMSTITYNISNSYLSLAQSSTFTWQAHFSPSKPPALNLYTDLAGFIGGAQHNLIMLMEQWTESGNINSNGTTLYGSTYLRTNSLGTYINSGKPFYGLFGNSTSTDPILNSFNNHANAHIKQVVSQSGVYGIHNKIALADAYRDTRYALRGKLLFGSMNWSQSGMHTNDEQTMIVKDPALANQYLQRAMAALGRENMMPIADTDIVLVLDRSASMSQNCTGQTITKVEAMKTAAKMFVDILAADGKHRISVVRFGDGVENNIIAATSSLAPLTPAHAALVKDEITSITTSGSIGNWTCYGSALQAALSRFITAAPPAKPRRFILFFTDGMENRAPYAASVYPSLVNENVEIHSIAFGNFSPFSSGGATAVLADMANASAGSFAQMDADQIKLKKRFAEIAADVMKSSVQLDPVYELSAKSPVIKIEIPEEVDSFQVIQLNETSSTMPMMDLIEPLAAKKSVRLAKAVQQYQNPSYQIFKYEMDTSQIKDRFLEMELRPQQTNLKQYEGKTHVMVVVNAPTTIQAEAVAAQAGQKDIVLLCRMLHNNQAFTNATVKAEWTTPVSAGAVQTTTVTLYDDGRHGDGQANDGLFGAPLTLNAAGNHAFHIVATASSKSRRLSPVATKKEAKLYKEQEELIALSANSSVTLSKAQQEKLAALLTQKIRRETTVYYTVNNR